jgi:hypothetical protein
MAGVRAVWVTTDGGKHVAVRVEYDDGGTGMIFADQLSMRSPSVPAAAKIQVEALRGGSFTSASFPHNDTKL